MNRYPKNSVFKSSVELKDRSRMKLKSLFLALTLLVSSIASVAAQDTNVATGQEPKRNQIYTAVLNNVQYERVEKKVDLGNALGQLANGFLNNRPVSINTETPFDDANGIVAAVINGLTHSYRMRVTDATNMFTGIQGNKYNFIMEVVVGTALTTTKTVAKDVTTKDKDGKMTTKKVNVTRYVARLDVTICQTDVETNQIVNSPNFVIVEEANTSGAAVSAALGSLTQRVGYHYRHAYPLTANIIEGARVKKEKQKELYIDLGEAEGAEKDIHMAVYEVRQVAGKSARQQLGKVKILEVQGDDISLCKVQSGSKDIKTAIDEGKTLIVISTD